MLCRLKKIVNYKEIIVFIVLFKLKIIMRDNFNDIKFDLLSVHIQSICDYFVSILFVVYMHDDDDDVNLAR